MKHILSASAFALALAAPAHAQSHHEHEAPAFSPERVGAEHMVMESSANEAAREPFVRGLALLHNFEYRYAAEEFRRAQEADPDFVMAYWGEAMTYNHPLWAEQDRDAAWEALSRLGADPAARAAKARSPVEAQWLGAIETLYAAEGTKQERDLAYLAAMRAMLDEHPDDIDVRAFTGLAVLGSSHGGRQIPIYMEAAGLLEPGFMTNEMHPGILHYLIHSYDDPVHAPLGERMAERYAVVAPDAGHAQHMVSHIFYALADWPATEAANVNAAGVVNRQRSAQGRPETSCGHYNEWLAYSLLQQGKDASGLVNACVGQIAAAAAEIAPDAEGDASAVRGAWSATRVAIFHGVDGGAWPEWFAIPATDENASARFQQAHGQLLQWWSGDRYALMGQAHAAIDTMKAVFAAVPEADREYASWSVRAIARSEALMMIMHEQEEAGMAALEEAAAAELAMPVVFGPPPIFKPSYEILGEMHLAAGRKQEAAEAFAKALELAPGRRLSLAGLAASES